MQAHRPSALIGDLDCEMPAPARLEACVLDALPKPRPGASVNHLSLKIERHREMLDGRNQRCRARLQNHTLNLALTVELASDIVTALRNATGEHDRICGDGAEPNNMLRLLSEWLHDFQTPHHGPGNYHHVHPPG